MLPKNYIFITVKLDYKIGSNLIYLILIHTKIIKFKEKHK